MKSNMSGRPWQTGLQVPSHSDTCTYTCTHLPVYLERVVPASLGVRARKAGGDCDGGGAPEPFIVEPQVLNF